MKIRQIITIKFIFIYIICFIVYNFAYCLLLNHNQSLKIKELELRIELNSKQNNLFNDINKKRFGIYIKNIKQYPIIKKK